MRYTPIFHFILLSSVLFLNSSSVTFADQTNGSCNADGMCNFKSCDVKKLRATSIQSTDKAPASNADGIQWQPYSPEAVNKAKLTHQMVIVFSKSDSCYWSQQMEKMTLSDPSVIKKN